MVDLLVIFVITFIVAFFSSQAGVSGAFIILPILVSFGYVSPNVSATNFLYNILAIPGGIYRYWREGRFAFQLFVVMAAGILPGICIGAVLRTTVLLKPSAFSVFVAAVLLIVTLRMLKSKTPKTVAGKVEIRSNFRTMIITFSGNTYKVSNAKLLVTSMVVGTVSGAYGVGGGALMAPILVSIFSLPIYVTAAATLASTYTASILGIAYYSILGYPPDIMLGAVIGFAGFAGIYVGARVQRFMPERAIRIVLAALSIALAAKLLFANLHEVLVDLCTVL